MKVSEEFLASEARRKFDDAIEEANGNFTIETTRLMDAAISLHPYRVEVHNRFERDKAVKWCQESFGYNVVTSSWTFCFARQDHADMFKLAYG